MIRIEVVYCQKSCDSFILSGVFLVPHGEKNLVGKLCGVGWQFVTGSAQRIGSC
jgi:hypothetical protein